MTLSDIAALASVISSLAVATSLIYLAMQVKQSDRNQRSAIIQGRTAIGVEAMFHAAEPHNAAVAAKVVEDPNNITATELIQYINTQRALWNWFEDAHFHHKASLLDGLAFEGFLTSIKGVLTQPTTRVFWKLNRNTYSPKFRQFVDGLLETTPIVHRRDLLARWKEELAKFETTHSPSESVTTGHPVPSSRSP